jgi:hypothetical protein
MAKQNLKLPEAAFGLLLPLTSTSSNVKINLKNLLI